MAPLTFVRTLAKRTTGLVGIAVNPQARTALIDLYQKTLQALSELPESAEYRQATEELTRRRLEIVQKETDHEAIERQIDCGHIEELVLQAQAELGLVGKMKEWKAWEPLATPPPPGQWVQPGGQ